MKTFNKPEERYLFKSLPVLILDFSVFYMTPFKDSNVSDVHFFNYSN